MNILLRAALLFLFTAGLSATAAATRPPPAEVLQALQRGVNLSIWFTYRGQPGIEPARWYPDAADWQLIKALGLTHVRVQFDPVYFRDPLKPGKLQAARLKELRQALAPAFQHGLLVVLAAEPEALEKIRLVRDEAGRAELAAFWGAFAKSLRGIAPRQLVFELLNEPTTADAASNRALMEQLVSAVRAVAPRHTLVVEGHAYSGIDELRAIEPLGADNLIYSFHFYESHIFTHQGAFWGWPLFQKFKGVPYPSSPEALTPLVDAAEDDAKPPLRDYGEQRWNQARIEARLDMARDWAQAQGLPVWCGEFGASRLGEAPAEARRQWLADVRSALETRQLPWTLFDYVGHFGVATGNGGTRVFDPLELQALGLNQLPSPP